MAEVIDIPHPRDVFGFEQGEAVEQAFLDAEARGRLHHAWLLTGPEGVGKATFAFRAARRLMGATPDPAFGLMGSRPDHPVSRQISARSHPDIMVLEREVEGGKPRKVIPVDEARKLPEFFSKAPASAPYRVAIVDAVDDMNPNSANALLKTLEEPPERGILFLTSHAPGGLLPTIRSRCRRLRFSPWGEEAVADFVGRHAELNAEERLRLARMSGGAPGKALELLARKALEADDAARDLLRALPTLDRGAIQALADGFRGADGMSRFTLLMERLADQIHRRVIADALDGDPPASAWAQTWTRLNELPGEVEGLNLDRADALWAAMADLRAVAAPGR